MDTQPIFGFWDRNRIIFKGILVAFLVLIMLIPQAFVGSLVRERSERQAQVTAEVSNKWAARQTVTGPVVVLPYWDSTKKKYAYVLPDELKISGNIKPTVKKRSLYNVMLYNSNLRLEGKFGQLPLEQLRLRADQVIWQEARLVLKLSDMRGLTEQVSINWNGLPAIMEPEISSNNAFPHGIAIPLNASAASGGTFSANVALKGSEYLYFTPVGKTTDVNISADWKDPKFDGQYLPETSTITTDKFSAHWKILPMSHSYPQYWKDDSYDMQESAFGVSLIQTVDGYAKTTRAVKYALLFIVLTFTCFFFLEVLLRKPIHAIQYILVGMALSIFYTLLLSISEYTGFDIAYGLAATATVILISTYVRSIFKNTRTALGFTTALTGLYGYIYILIQLEDYALLFGTIGLFGILATIMFYSRKIDWYNAYKHQNNDQ